MFHDPTDDVPEPPVPVEWEQILGNPAIEKAAIAYVIGQERLEGRTARDARGSGRGGAGDVESDGRIIEVKAFSQWGLRNTGLLLFTPGQLREGERNPDYYVYIVENVAQGDPSKFELRVLHGEALQRLFAGAKPQRFYVPVRAADYAGLTRLGRADVPEARAEDGTNRALPMLDSRPQDRAIAVRRNAKPIRDIETGAEYPSEFQAGKALCGLVGGAVTDRFVWFKIRRAFPTRFQTKNPAGEWVALTDPSVHQGTTRPRS